MHPSFRFAACLLSATAALASPATAQAGVVVLSTGFEASTYAPGQLAGQDGWTGATMSAVQNTVAASGQQAAAVNTAGRSGQHLTVHGVDYNSVGNAEQTVRVSIAFMLGNLSNDAVYLNALALFGNAGFISQMVVDGVSGRLCDGSGCNGPLLGVNTWHQLMVEIDYASGDIEAYVDGALWSATQTALTSTTLNTIGFGINNAAASSNSMSYYDNLRIESFGQAVPEPASLALAGLALAALAGVRRKQAPVAAVSA